MSDAQFAIEFVEGLERLYAEVRKDPQSRSLIINRAAMEGTTYWGVLREFGDPRKWPEYAREAQP